MYQDDYARQEVYCDAKFGDNDYCTYMDPNMLLATCTQPYAIETEESQWYNSALSSPVNVQMQYVENMPLPPSPTDSLTYSPYSETISQQPSPIEGTFDYYPAPMHDMTTPYNYLYYSQPSPLMEDLQHHHIHHHHDDGAMCSPQLPVYPSIISGQGEEEQQQQQQQQQQDHSPGLDTNTNTNTTTTTTPSSLVAVAPSSTTTATNTTTTVAATNNNASSNTSTPIRPYPCYLCSRAFARKHDLQRHIRVHTGAKPFACLCCKKAFARTDALKRHLRMEETCRTSPEIQAMKCAGKRRYRNL